MIPYTLIIESTEPGGGERSGLHIHHMLAESAAQAREYGGDFIPSFKSWWSELWREEWDVDQQMHELDVLIVFPGTIEECGRED